MADYQITLAPRPPVAPVATVLTPAERLRVDAAGQGLYRTLHRETLDDAIRDVRERRASAVLVSVACCGDGDGDWGAGPVAERVAALVREFPRVPAVALLTELRPATPRTVLSLGRSGVRTLVKVCAKLLSTCSGYELLPSSSSMICSKCRPSVCSRSELRREIPTPGRDG